MTDSEARTLFGTARVVRLATVGPDGRPHQVPICFALDDDTIWSAIDHKPKRTRSLRRLENIAASPEVAILADRYEEDWSRLWWVRADGRARIAEGDSPERSRAVELLVARYEQYRERPPEGPAIAVEVVSWSGWRAADF